MAVSLSATPPRRAAAAAFACLALSACVHPRNDATLDVVLVGDSTVSAYGPERYPRMGWGMVLACGLRLDGSVVNFAASGRSTKSFMDEGRWAAALEALHKGDVLLIQFGHNDQKSDDPKRYTDPDGVFSRNLGAMIDGARAKGAVPVLVTPAPRRRFAQGAPVDTHGDYAAAVRRVAHEQGVFLVDLSASGLALLAQVGEQGSKALYLHYAPEDGVSAYPDGISDDTHFSEQGARAIARLVVRRLAEDGSPLALIADSESAFLAPGFIAGGPGCLKAAP